MCRLVVPVIIFAVAIRCTLAANEIERRNQVETCRNMYKNDLSKKNLDIPEFPTILGAGWDNLQNIPKSQIVNLTYIECNLTPDLAYLTPDPIDIIVVKNTHLDRSANFYSTFSSYTDSTSMSINLDASGGINHFQISGSLSVHAQEVKSHSLGEQSSIFRTKLDHLAYKASVRPNANLDSTFKHRIYEIGNALLKNHTKLAKYLSQLIIRDFGTHVVTNVDVGATLVQEDFVDSKSMSDKKSNLIDMRAAAAVSFLGIAGVRTSASRQVSADIQTQYQSMIKHSQFIAHGGPNVNNLLEVNSTDKMSIDNLVALDRNGQPIYFLISEDHFPDLPLPTVSEMQTYIKNATDEYYKRNTVFGCLNVDAKNFNYNANVDDHTCQMPYNNYTFGGLFQTCRVVSGATDRCDKFQLKHGITGGYSCPKDGNVTYDAVNLLTTSHTFPPRKEQYCDKRCHGCGFLWLSTCCTTTCHDVFFIDEIAVEAFWCSAPTSEHLPPNTGYLFGGLFTSKMSNPFSGASKCPGKFIESRIGVDLTVCLSRDYQLDFESSVPFAGFFSCLSPVKKCDDGYSQHLAEIIDGCEIYYCVRPESFEKSYKTKVNMPPFVNFPYEYEAFTLLQTYQDGRIWHRPNLTNSSWSLTRILQSDGSLPNHMKLLTEWNKQVEKHVDESKTANDASSKVGLGAGAIAGIVFGCVGLLMIIVVVVGLLVKKKASARELNYERID